MGLILGSSPLKQLTACVGVICPSMSSTGNWGSECKDKFTDTGYCSCWGNVFCLCFRSLMSFLTIYTLWKTWLLPCKWSKISYPSQLATLTTTSLFANLFLFVPFINELGCYIYYKDEFFLWYPRTIKVQCSV